MENKMSDDALARIVLIWFLSILFTIGITYSICRAIISDQTAISYYKGDIVVNEIKFDGSTEPKYSVIYRYK